MVFATANISNCSDIFKLYPYIRVLNIANKLISKYYEKTS